MAIRLVLVDDHPLFRAGVRALLQDEDDLQVVGEASSGEEGVEKARALKPDVVVMDLAMEDSDGLEATRRIVALGLTSKVFVLTAQDLETHLIPVLNAGASGYLSKIAADRELVDAVRAVAGGGAYLPPEAARGLLAALRAEEPTLGVELGDLPIRDQEILALVASGFTSREVGERLFLSPKTVDTYRARLMAQLGLTHRSELVDLALRTGLIGRY